MEKMISILEDILQKKKGNIIEIGAGVGDTTKALLFTAEKFGVKVIVIDPHELGWDQMPETYGKPYTYKNFLSNVEPYINSLVHFRVSSLEPDLYEKLKPYEPFAFSFVDGLQFKDAVLSDLNLMHKLNLSVICVDDFTRNTELSQVPEAIEEFLKKNDDYEIINESVESRAKAFLIKKQYENQ